MKIFLIGMGLLLSGLILQVAIWRLRLPKSQTMGILVLFSGLLALFLLLQALGIFSGTYLDLSFVESVYLGFMVLSVLPGYVIVYGLVEVDSPSSRMALALEVAGAKGLPVHGFRWVVTDEIFISSRLKVLEDGGQLLRRDGRYSITPHGARYLALFLFPRKLMGKTQYGG